MLSIVTYPTKSLNKLSVRITKFDSALKTLVHDMNKAMIREKGIGLAAPQIGKNIKLIIVKVGEEGDAYAVYVNPEITFSSKKKAAIEEGCLSLPNVFGYVERAAKIRFQYQDLQGKKHTEKAKGMEAIVLEHEIDHINGTLIVDRNIELTKGTEIFERSKVKKK